MTKKMDGDRKQEEKTIKNQILLRTIIHNKEYALKIVHDIKTEKVISKTSE